MVTVALFISYHVIRFGYKLTFSTDNKKEAAIFDSVDSWLKKPLNLLLLVLTWLLALVAVQWLW
ncbi:MAG: hypothetical protein K0Q43_25 [Ramlibacter sp.]|nr:hypothetical protein [Ramlibacter sp.]